MFQKRILLQPKEHTDLRLASTTNWRFAAQEMLVPLVYTELADAAREYPLIFVKGKPAFYALTGIEQGVNAYVAEDGRWLANYIPAYLRAYPLALTPVPDKPNEFALVLDSDAPQLMEPNGHRLFENDQPTTFLNNRMVLLRAIQKAEPMTHRLVKTIQDADLLMDRNIHIKRPGAQDVHIGGLQVVNEKKLNALPHDAFASLRDQGVLPLIYAHLLSMANLRQGALAGKYPQLAANDNNEMLTALLKADTMQLN